MWRHIKYCYDFQYVAKTSCLSLSLFCNQKACQVKLWLLVVFICRDETVFELYASNMDEFCGVAHFERLVHIHEGKHYWRIGTASHRSRAWYMIYRRPLWSISEYWGEMGNLLVCARRIRWYSAFKISAQYREWIVAWSSKHYNFLLL